MKHKLLISIFSLFLLFSFGSVEQVLACMCGKSETCERYNYSDAIFIGKAIGIEKEKSGFFETESTIFEIQESFLGENKKQIKVTNKIGSSCDVSFKNSETYLIFAGKTETGELVTSFCNGNIPIEYANDEIANIRKLLKESNQGKLFGLVTEIMEYRAEKNKENPISNISIQAEEITSGKTYLATTNKEGKYELFVPAGNYKVLPILPNYAEFDYFDKGSSIKEKGCSQQFYRLKNKSRLAGKLVDYDGKPISNTTIELSSTDLKEKTWRGSSYLLKTNENGFFELANIPSGEYIISYNFYDFPDSIRPFPTSFYNNSANISNAKIIKVNLGENVEDIEFQLLPRLSEVEIYGSIYWNDGSIANGISYFLEDSEYPDIYVGCIFSAAKHKNYFAKITRELMNIKEMPINCTLKSDEKGIFRIKGFKERKYRIKAETSKIINGQKIDYFTESELFSVDENLKELKLVLREK